MSIRTKIKALFANEDITIKEVAQKISEIKNKQITPDSISQKLLRESIKFSDVEEILNVLGYEIIFQKRNTVK